MACVNVHCLRCDPTLAYRHGQTPQDLVRFHCRECRSVFQMTYKSGCSRANR
ncbi:MAG: IS1 family transposase [Serratia symbiotica]|nr:IS1 family transposase [Serratia symbiotica]